MSRRLVVATHNRKKGVEMTAILGRRFPELEIVTLDEYPEAPEPEETGATYSENAVIKADSACLHTGQWCVADDAGLEIDVLPNLLGVFSKRFEGEETPFPEKMARILELMAETPDEKRTARFRAFVALARPGFETEVFEGACEGLIARAPVGEGGFGYDPIFWTPSFQKTLAQLTPEQKHSISHRGMVLARTGDRLGELLKTQD